MLDKIADFYDEEVQSATEQLTAMIEPLMIAFLGVVIGGMGGRALHAHLQHRDGRSGRLIALCSEASSTVCVTRLPSCPRTPPK